MAPTEGAATETGGAPSNERRDTRRTINRPTSNKTVIPKQPRFEGECEELKGNIYDCSDIKQADTFMKTNKAVAGHVGRNYKYGGDIRNVVDNLELPTLQEPQDYATGASKTTIRIWEKEVDEYVKRKIYLFENVRTLYSLVWGQCTDIMRSKLEGLDRFEKISSDGDGLELLKAIKEIVYQFQSQKYLPHSLHESKQRFYQCTQGKYLTAAQYLEKFQNIVDVIEQTGGSVGVDPGIESALITEKGMDATKMSADEVEENKKDAQGRYLAVAFLLGADRNRYGKMVEDLENDFLQGQNNYPRTLTAAYHLLTNWKQDPRNLMRPFGPVNDGLAFANDGRRDKSNITCHKCNKKGHYANECTEVTAGTNDPNEGQASGTSMLMAGVESGEFDNGNYAFSQQDGRIPKTWILLDNQSTIDVFHNATLLKNIRQSDSQMKIHCNAGVTSTNMVGDLPGYGTVWYHPNGIANILSLSRVADKGYMVSYNSGNGNEFVLTKPDGTTKIFQQSENGLFYHDTELTATILINTVEGNRSSYTNRDYSRATLARNIQKIIGRPSTKAFIKIVENNLLPNCPVTRRDIIAAEHIFGPDVGSLKGKTVHKAATSVDVNTVDLPATVMSHYQDIVLAADIMFVNGIPFFVTISRNIKFGTAEMIQNQQAKTILTAINQVKATYVKRGFNITTLLMDGQFDSLRGELSNMGITLNTVANAEHVPEIERHIRTVKERVRCVYNTLPFTQLTARMIIELVYYSTFWLNSFPAEGGVSDTLSPRAIVTGMQLDYNKHCRLEYGTYVQTHEEHDNSMATRTTGAIALRPTGNMQGGYYFLSLTTGRVLNRNHWTPLPMPADVIDRIHVLARRNPANAKGLAFANRQGAPLIDDDDDDDNDDESWTPDDADDNPTTDEDTECENENEAEDADDDANGYDIPAAIHPPIAGVNENEENEEDGNPIEEDEPIEEPIENPNDEPNEDPVEEQNDAEFVEHIPAAEQQEPAAEQQHILEQEMDNAYGPRTSGYNLRPRHPCDYSHLHTVLEGTAMTQHSLKKGIKLFGDAGVDAVLKELQQLHDRGVVEPKGAGDLSCEEKKAALQYLMFIKKKRNGTIKGRGCADGRKQRAYTNKEDASSPTVAIESVMLSCTIDAKEERDVATVDIPGAFMQADMDETVHMKLEGTMAELLVKLDPKLYRKYVQMENGKQVLYLELRKALYGTLKAALLFWKRLTSELESWGFVINPYDWCVANKDINGSQCTILWHVDDLKISHVDPDVVTDVIQRVESVFGKEAPLTITRGKIHDYLGMKLDYGIPGKVKISMVDYVQNLLDEAPDDMIGESATPAANHLFEVNETNPTQLDQTTADLFHHIVAKLLFLCKRARPDIQTAVAFLCTRVKSPDHDDYKKLARVIRYLRSTIDMPLTLEAENLQVMKWWVDSSFAVHPDMRSHTGGAMTLGKGVIYGTSTRQKLNTKSSTECELVGVNDVLPQILWTRYFLEAQGYGANESIVYQDNQSAILLEKNGRASSSKRTRHLNIRYFFVTDRVAAKEVSIQYCPTTEMIADFFTKPLQGALFRTFRDFIMNVAPPAHSLEDHRSVLCKNENLESADLVPLTSLIPAPEPDTSNEWTVVEKKKKGVKSLPVKSLTLK
jgi:hypothetical protein